MLAQYGLKPQPANNDEHSFDLFVELLKGKHEAYVQGEVYENVGPEEYLEPAEVEVLRLLNEEPRLRLSDALQVYLSGHKNKSNKKFRADTERVWARLITLVGDKEFEQVGRADANEFVSRGIAEGSKTTTVERQISVIRAVFNVVIVEKEVAKSNPFLSVRIPGLGEDSKVREPFDNDQLVILIEESKKRDDDIHWLIALQIDLGCRVAEAAGLALSDLHLHALVPYVSLRPHP